MKFAINNRFNAPLCLIAIGVVALWVTSCSRSPSFNEFMARDQKYYAELAQACEQLLSQTNVVRLKPSHRAVFSIFSVSPEDANLPEAIRNLRPSQIEVDRCETGVSNCLTFVWIKLGVSGAGFGIRWSSNAIENGQIVWELSVGGGEAGGGVVYKR